MDRKIRTGGSANILRRVVIILVLGCCSLSVQAKYGGGSGEPNDPYQISNASHMQAIGTDPCDWDKSFKLMSNIDLSGFTGTSFNIIGTDYLHPFTGVFDGNGHTISNFTNDPNGNNGVGLFGYVYGYDAEIRNLGLIDPNVNAGTRHHVGSLVGRLSVATVTNCYAASCSILGTRSVGGLVGNNYYGKITNCYTTGFITGTTHVGAMVGWSYGGKITSCYTSSTVSGTHNVGGLVGLNWHEVSNCYSISSVVGDVNVGGLVGRNEGTITNCYSTGRVLGNSSVGGLVGLNDFDEEVIASFWDTETSGQTTSNGGTGLTMKEMQMQITFMDAGWDFITPIWKMSCEGMSYPKLTWWQPMPGDVLCPDGVNFSDYSYFAGQWQKENCGASNDCDGTDLNLSGKVEISDLRIFVHNWLRGF